MTSPLRSVLHALKVLFLALTVLCVLMQPVVAAAHELHDAEHALANAAGGPQGEADSPEPGSLDGLLHAFDCCLHATGLPTPALDWTAQRLGAAPPRVSLPLHTPSPLSRFLRPPITA